MSLPSIAINITYVGSFSILDERYEASLEGIFMGLIVCKLPVIDFRFFLYGKRLKRIKEIFTISWRMI